MQLGDRAKWELAVMSFWLLQFLSERFFSKLLDSSSLPTAYCLLSTDFCLLTTVFCLPAQPFLGLRSWIQLPPGFQLRQHPFYLVGFFQGI